MTIYVANLDTQTEDDDLRVLFRNYGAVTNVYIFRDRNTGDPLGYAFVTMPSDWDAERAIRDLNGTYLKSRRLKVSERRPRDRDDG